MAGLAARETIVQLRNLIVNPVLVNPYRREASSVIYKRTVDYANTLLMVHMALEYGNEEMELPPSINTEPDIDDLIYGDTCKYLPVDQQDDCYATASGILGQGIDPGLSFYHQTALAQASKSPSV